MIVRLEPDQIDILVPLTHEMNRVSGTHYKPNDEKFVESISSMVGNDTAIAFGIFEEKPPSLIGALIGVCMPDFMSDEVKAQKIFWYSRKPSSESISLLRHYENWAIQKGATRIGLGAMKSFDQQDTTSRYFERLGYHEIESHFEKIIKPPGEEKLTA